MDSDWTPDSWKSFEAKQQPKYPDEAELNRVLDQGACVGPVIAAVCDCWHGSRGASRVCLCMVTARVFVPSCRAVCGVLFGDSWLARWL
jgi:hypothetical protein